MRGHGFSPRAGTLPVPAVRVNQRTILVSPDTALRTPVQSLGLYARVSSHDQRQDLDRQLARLSEWAAKTGHPVVRVEAEVGSGMNGTRTKLRRLLADPKVSVVVVEHRDRLARMNAELVEAALSAHGRRLVVIDDDEVDDDVGGHEIIPSGGHQERPTYGHQLSLCAAMGFPHARPRN